MGEKVIKNVNLKRCINTIIWSIIGLVVFLIPMTFGSAGMTLAFKGAPLIGDGPLATIQTANAVGLAAILHLDAAMAQTLSSLFNLATTCYIVILALNVIFCLLLFITRSQILRLIFRIASMVFGVFMLLNLFLSLANVIGIAGIFTQGSIPAESIMPAIESSGILFFLGMTIFSGRLSYKQFHWYDKLY